MFESIRSRLMAKTYDAFTKTCEERCLGAWRADLLKEVSGDVLEIGSGTGANLEHYPREVTRLVLSEPDANMRKRLRRRVDDSGRDGVSIVAFGAESIDLPDESFDTIVSTLVLCSVRDPSRSLSELKRLLRPGGSLVFIEHVAADDRSRLRTWQGFFEPLWRRLIGNCHLTRKTEDAIRQAGFTPTQVVHDEIEGGVPLIKPSVRGVARK